MASWAALMRPLGGLLGRLGAVLGASWAVFERRKPEKARKPKTSKKTMNINDFGFLGPSWEASWKPLGASWRHLGPSGGHLERLRAIFRRLGALLDRLGSFLGASWLVFGPPSRLSGADDPPRAAPGNPGESRGIPGNPAGHPPPPNRPDQAPGGGVWGGGRISHADDPQGAGGFLS